MRLNSVWHCHRAWSFSRGVRSLTAITIAASLFGLFGALIAVQTVAFLTLLYNEYYLTSRWYGGEA